MMDMFFAPIVVTCSQDINKNSVLVMHLEIYYTIYIYSIYPLTPRSL